jgi:hypothetical protein
MSHGPRVRIYVSHELLIRDRSFTGRKIHPYSYNSHTCPCLTQRVYRCTQQGPSVISQPRASVGRPRDGGGWHGEACAKATSQFRPALVVGRLFPMTPLPPRVCLVHWPLGGVRWGLPLGVVWACSMAYASSPDFEHSLTFNREDVITGLTGHWPLDCM